MAQQTEVAPPPEVAQEVTAELSDGELSFLRRLFGRDPDEDLTARLERFKGEFWRTGGGHVVPRRYWIGVILCMRENASYTIEERNQKPVVKFPHTINEKVDVACKALDDGNAAKIRWPWKTKAVSEDEYVGREVIVDWSGCQLVGTYIKGGFQVRDRGETVPGCEVKLPLHGDKQPIKRVPQSAIKGLATEGQISEDIQV